LKPRLGFVRARLSDLKKHELYRKLLSVRLSGQHIIFENKKLVNLSSNDYLGLGLTKIPKSQLQSSSRLISGNDELFEKLEARLSRHKHQEASLVFPTGYMANLGMLSILPQEGDLILSDELNHASIIDSCRLSRARKSIYRHDDLQDLERKIRSRARRKFVITEGIFSMNGDFSRLDEIAEICCSHGAFLLLDDAHGDFVAGPDGRGSASHFRVSKKVDVYISSLSKGLGAFGGYASASKDVINLAVNTSRPFIYTSALPNFLVHAAIQKFDSDREKKRIRLWRNSDLLRKGLRSSGFEIESPSQIIPIVIGPEKKAMDFGRYLYQNGVFAQPVRYPTVARGKARIRISVTAWLSQVEIEKSLGVFERAGKKFGIT